MASAHRTGGSPRLSVLMPARNAALTIGRALSSTLRALPDDAELLVLDDKSDDETPDIVRKAARDDGRVGLIDGHGSPLGVAGACNALLDASSAPLFARMDADDVTLPGRFRRQLRDVRDADFTFCNTIFFGPGRWSVEPVPVLSSGPRSSLYELIVHDPFFHPALLGRRSAMDRMGGYRDVPSEDWDLFMRSAVDGGRLTRSAIPGIAYRRHATQVTKGDGWIASVVNSADMREAHEALCEVVLGRRPGAFRALAGAGATAEEALVADETISAVEATTERFPLPHRVSLRVTTHGVRRRLHGRYPDVFATAPACRPR